jgi:hypothetical protein
MGTNYGIRPIIITKDGNKVEEKFDFSTFKNLWLNIKTDVGASSYWSEVASVQTLDNLLKQGLIEIIDYLESLPDGYLMHKQELIDKLKAKAEQLPQSQPQLGLPQGNTQLPPKQPQPQLQNATVDTAALDQFVSTLPTDVQAKLKALPPTQYQIIVTKMMHQAEGQKTQ